MQPFAASRWANRHRQAKSPLRDTIPGDTTGSDSRNRDGQNRDSMETKRDRVRAMFGRVARNYDYLNSVLSMGLHHRWRRFAVRECEFPAGGRALDVAAGTGDFAIETIKRGGDAVGVDVCEPMFQEV